METGAGGELRVRGSLVGALRTPERAWAGREGQGSFSHFLDSDPGVPKHRRARGGPRGSGVFMMPRDGTPLALVEKPVWTDTSCLEV